MSRTDRKFGWIDPKHRTPEMKRAHGEAMEKMPAFKLLGDYTERQGRFALWHLAKLANGGEHLRYVWQVTGSCVGAGGYNCLQTKLQVDRLLGKPMLDVEHWWLWTYGQSRFHAGLNGPGEGSFGSAYARAVVEDGVWSKDDLPDAPALGEKDGWLQVDRKVELEWSDGRKKRVEPYIGAGRRHPLKSTVPIKTVDELKACIQGGLSPASVASMFGCKTVRRQGENQPVNMAVWDDNWAHQTWFDEAWDHPELGLIFRWGNNWGPTMGGLAPPPTQGEPAGGVYLAAGTVKKILARRDTECFGFSGAFDGLEVPQMDWATV